MRLKNRLKLALGLALISLSSVCFADNYISTAPLNIQTVDGTSSAYPYSLVISSGTFSSGVVWIGTGGGGASGTNSIGGLTGISGTAPLFVSGGSVPSIWITQASSISSGYISVADWNTFATTQSGGGAGIAGLTGTNPILTGGGSVPNIQLGYDKFTLTLTGGSLGVTPTMFMNAGSLSGGLAGLIGTSPILATGGSVPTISIIQASSIASGYLSVTDWNTFAGTGGVGGLVGLSGTSPLFVSGGSIPSLWIINASSISSGVLTRTDWNTFSNTIGVPYLGGLTGLVGTSPITTTGGSVPTISIATASSIATGALSFADWNTFTTKSNVLSVSGSAPLVVSSGTKPTITLTYDSTLTLTAGTLGVKAGTYYSGGALTGLTGLTPVTITGGSTPTISLLFSNTTGGLLYTSSGSAVSATHIVWDENRNILTISGGTSPYISTSAGAGSGATLTLTGGDGHGTLTLVSGSAPTATYILTVTFGAGTYPTAPAVVFCPSGPNSAGLSNGLIPSITSSTLSFSIVSGGTAINPQMQYMWNYINNG